MKKMSLTALSYDELQELISSISEDNPKAARYRTSQICDWIYNKKVTDFSQMSNLSKDLRHKLDTIAALELPVVENETISADGTTKYLLKLRDERQIEIVIIKERKGANKANKTTLCISSQIGCARGCKFCATSRLGFIRNLTVDEIVGQFLTASKLSEERLTNLVFMGMGEPLDNYKNVCKAINIIQDTRMISFSPRRMTLSTCGVAPNIIRLSEEGIKLKLAVSLNSANQIKREQIMPCAAQYPLPELKKALLTYQRTTSFRITFEYVMLKGFNTFREDAKFLMGYLGDISSKINLIAWNGSDLISEYQTPDDDEIERFIKYLMPFANAITYRKSKGADIAAACGQLVGRYSLDSEDAEEEKPR